MTALKNARQADLVSYIIKYFIYLGSPRPGRSCWMIWGDDNIALPYLSINIEKYLLAKQDGSGFGSMNAAWVILPTLLTRLSAHAHRKQCSTCSSGMRLMTPGRHFRCTLLRRRQDSELDGLCYL